MDFGLNWRSRGLIERLRTSGTGALFAERLRGGEIGKCVDCMRSGSSGCGFGFGVLISLSFAVVIPGPLDVREAGRLIGMYFFSNNIYSGWLVFSIMLDKVVYSP